MQPAEDVARIGVAALARGKRTVIPNMMGRSAAFAVRLFPTSLIGYFVEKFARPATQ